MYIMETKYLSLYKFVKLYMNYFVLKKRLLLLRMLIKAWSQQERKLMFTHIPL